MCVCATSIKSVISEHWLQITFMGTSEIALRWMPQKIFDDKSVLVQVMGWHHLATSHYLANVDLDTCQYITSLGHNE